MKKLLIFIFVLSTAISSQASHLMGGQVSYDHISGNDYRVRVDLIIACQGIQTDSVQLNAISATTSQHIIQNLPLSNRIYLSNVCSAAGQNCLPNSMGVGSVLSTYEAVMNLPNASDWKLVIHSVLRSASNTVGLGNIYLDATLNNATTSFNSSARLPSFKPLDYHQLGVLQNIALNAVDPDGDSLDYSLVTAQTGSMVNPNPITYNAPYSPSFPINSSSVINLDPTTGVLSFTGAQLGSYTVAIQIDEYRSGSLIASSVYERILAVITDTSVSNVHPTIVGANAQNVLNVNVCPSNSLNLTLNTADLNTTDSTFIFWDSTLTNANFTVSPGLNESAVLSWTPTALDVSPTPYIVSFRVTDNNCTLLGANVYTYLIYVNQCSPDSVWAGDANADFICNNYDVLNIGIANGTTGTVRAGATTNWQGEWCPNWATTFINNIDYKHADCNGDGVINSADLSAVATNYGLIHQKTSNVGQYKTLGLPDLYCDVNSVQAHRGSTVSIPVMLGTLGSEINDFYGISATVELVNAQISAPIGVSKNVSWIGNATNSFGFEKNIAPNKSAFTFVRNNQQNLMNQQGQIGEITFPIDAGSVIGSQVTVQFSDIKMIKKTGEEITNFNVINDSFEILAPTTLYDFDKKNSVSVYPNPTKNKITIAIHSDISKDYSIVLYDLVGRVINADIFAGSLSAGEHKIDLDLRSQAQGSYLLEIKSDSGKRVLPIQKL